MIKTFKSKPLRRFWERGDASKLPTQQHADRVRRQLAALDAAAHPSEMNVPGWRWEAKTGPMKGSWTVWVTGNYRLHWRWDDGAIDVDLVDYH